MAKKIENKAGEIDKQPMKTNSLTIDLVERQIKNFLIRTKNEEKRVDDVLDAVTQFRKDFQDRVNEMLKSSGVKAGEKIPEDKIEEINRKYQELVVNLVEFDEESFQQFTEDEFIQATDGLVLPYQDLKILKRFLIKAD